MGGHGHGHDEGHAAHAGEAGHDAHGGHDGHGAADLPPEPTTRSITPAREDFEQPWPGNLLLWPVVWLGVALLFVLVARAWTGPVDAHHGEGGHEAPAHGAPAH